MATITDVSGSVKAGTKRRSAAATMSSAPSAKGGGTPDLVGKAGVARVKKPSVAKRPKITGPAAKARFITYARIKGVDFFVDRVAGATPMEMIDVERHGVDGMFLKDLSKHMRIPAVRMFEIVGVPKATAEKKVAADEPIAGAGGQAALGLARLLAIAKKIVENSTAAEAKGFDTAKWLGEWIELPQPALGGRKPADIIKTPTGLEMVARVLGAIESGAYQ